MESEIKFLKTKTNKKTEAKHKISYCILLSPKTSQGGASLSSKVIHDDRAAYTVSTSSLTMKVKQSPMPSAGQPQEVTVRPHMPSSSQIQ